MIAMHALSAHELLRVWEQGLVQSSIQRPLILLTIADSEMLPDELGQLSIGQRDARLLRLREAIFGSKLACVAKCHECGERLEATLDTADLSMKSAAKPTEPLSLSVDGYELRFRLPNSVDMAAITSEKDAPTARQRLLQRCLLVVQYGGESITADRLPATIVDAIAECMAHEDSQANIQISLSCPQCAHHWLEAFDIASFLWTEIDAWVRRLLQEVHLLATAYGWTERDILTLTPWRRHCYLSMVGG